MVGGGDFSVVNVNSAEEILALNKCGDIFSNDPVKAKEEYRKLVRIYHPDVNDGPLADQAFKNINGLYNKARKLFGSGQWEVSNRIEFIDKETGISRTLKFLKESDFELGKQYISSTVVAYVLGGKNKRYYDNMLKRLGSIHYSNIEMEKEFSRYFPRIKDNFETTDGKWVIVIEKNRGLLRVYDVLDYYKGCIPDRHVAWIISRLCNICCFLEYNKIAHNGISIENCFISPENHSVALLGGWWYCVKHGEKMIGTQKEIYNIMSPLVKTSKIGGFSTDLESVK